MPQTVDFQLGEDYIDIRPLAEGGMGTLYRAYRRGLGVEVVIKRVRSQFVGKLDQKAEANILKRLKHRYLPRIYDIINRDDGYFYTVMDYIPGMNMQQYIHQHGPADQKTAHKWACQLCEVVAYLHEQHPPIIHCDIKPSNLMITPEGDLCLIDFNTSLIFSEGALARGATPGFAAPEQYTRPAAAPAAQKKAPADQATVLVPEQESETPSRATPRLSFSAAVSARAGGYGPVSKRTDVYGIGATLYYLVTGHTPERALDPVTPLEDYRPAISATFASIITRAMAKQPEQRFGDAQEMLRALQDVDELDARFRRCRRWRRVSRVVLTLCFVLSLASAAYGVLRIRAERDNSYLTLVSQGEALAQQGDSDGAGAVLQQAIQSFPDRAEAYLAYSAQLYEQASYQEAYDLIQNALVSGSLQLDRLPADQAGDLLYVQANCVYEQQAYEQALALYRQALDYRQDNTAYYRGLALAQARSGDLTGAQQTLQTLQQQGGSTVDCEIVSAEISTKEGDYAGALAQYQDVLTRTQDVSVLSRVYLAAADLCDQLGDQDGRIALLRQAVERLGEDGTLHEETLAQALAEKAQQDPQNQTALYEEARQHLEHVVDSGRGNILTSLNLAVVLETLGDYDEAEQQLLTLRDTDPTDYRVYMRLAFLYADRQAQLPISQRDYSAVADNYALAQQYYEQAVANGASDLEMSRLDSLMEQLRISGWID